MISAMIVTRPIFSSDQASDRVLGISVSQLSAISGQLSAVSSQLSVVSCRPSAQEFSNVRIGRGAQRVGVALEDDQAVAQHDELRLALLLARGGQNLHRAVR